MYILGCSRHIQIFPERELFFSLQSSKLARGHCFSTGQPSCKKWERLRCRPVFLWHLQKKRGVFFSDMSSCYWKWNCEQIHTPSKSSLPNPTPTNPCKTHTEPFWQDHSHSHRSNSHHTSSSPPNRIDNALVFHWTQIPVGLRLHETHQLSSPFSGIFPNGHFPTTAPIGSAKNMGAKTSGKNHGKILQNRWLNVKTSGESLINILGQ